MSIYTYCTLCGNRHDSSACSSACLPPEPCAECARLRAEIEALRKDAERYRKVRRHEGFYFSSDDMTYAEVDEQIDRLPDAPGRVP